MKRLILSTIGVMLTFTWIIYTAPPAEKQPAASGEPIKIINKSGASPTYKISPVRQIRGLHQATDNRNLLVEAQIINFSNP